MDDGELDFSNQEVFSTANMCDAPSSLSMDSFFDELLKDTHACTHTHTCNPPGPDFSHTHTCFHVHTKIVPALSDDKVSNDDTAESTEKSKKRPAGNKEAVRKYREKKKARTASLEDEVVKLRALNQQLLKRLQGQAVLEAEIARLKCLLVDIRGRIEGEIGSFPFKKPANNVSLSGSNFPGAFVMNPCNIQCDNQAYCPHPGAEGTSGDSVVLGGNARSGCDFENLQCMLSQYSENKALASCGQTNVATNAETSIRSKKKANAE